MNIGLQLLYRARQYPNAPAVTVGGETTTFAQLGDRVSRIATSMRDSIGLSQGDRVLLWMENSREFIETLFASWVAGVCVVPVNPKLHGKEVAHICNDSGVRAVFTTENFAQNAVEHLGDLGCRPNLIIAGSPAYEALAGGSVARCRDVLPSDPAWIFYTSGTTGFPKGAVLSHRNLMFMILAYYADIEQVAPGQTMLHAAPLSHGSGQYMLPHLLGGGHQVILKKFDPVEVLQGFQAHHAVSMFAVPTMITRLVQAAAGIAGCAGNLQTIIYGGSPMYVSDLLNAMDVFGPRFYQLYGQGETPMTITGLNRHEHSGLRDAAHLARLATCGVARTGVQVRVVDSAGSDVPMNEPGEIVTRSDCVMSGYWNNLAASAAALRDGWLWTGDIGSLDEAGYLTLRDRSKDMLISGGSNIYPREIEEVLLRHSAVLECSVVGRAHQDLGEEPVAFVVLRPGLSVLPEELDALCLEHIARFKRPRQYRFVEALPKSNYGKILKIELRSLLQAETQNGTPAPETTISRQQ